MKSRCLKLKYGQKEIRAQTTCGCEPKVLLPRSLETSVIGPTIIRSALERPIESPRLSEIVTAGDRIVIVASDCTRVTASHVFLPILVDELNRAGIPDRDIAIVIALGIHRPQTEEERRSLLGDALYKRIRTVDHDARNRDDLVFYGTTSHGTEVAVNRIVAEADKIVLTGAVSPHYFAGFGGGRKSIMPGVCSLEANLQSHVLVFNPLPGRGRNPFVRVARLAGNPVHEDMLEAARMVGPHFMLNTIVGTEKNLVASFAGDPIAAHEAACKYYLENFTVVVETPADLTIVSCGGHPKDVNFIQAHKAIHAAYSVTKPGGWMIVLAACSDGFGYPGFLDWFRFEDTSEFEAALRANYEIYGQTAYATFEKATTVNIMLVSELEAAHVRQMKMRPAATFEEAYQLVAENLPENFETYVIPGGASTLFLTAEEYAASLESVTGELRSEAREIS